MQPESWALSPDYAENIYGQDALDTSEHVTGNKNKAFSGLTNKLSIGAWQWIIVVGAIALLWGGHFHFKSAFKAVL